MTQPAGCRKILNLDFTLDKYEELCETITRSNYTSVTLTDYLQMENRNNSKSYIIMRHDIDRAPQQALKVAKIEKTHNIRGTYYFRDQRTTYILSIMDEIASYGHEIGYHYETLDKCKGNIESAKILFSQELADFKQRYYIKTVCAHGNPLTRYDNKDIWKSLNLSDFELLGEAFLTLDYDKFAYFSDSGRTWLNDNAQKMPGKDSVISAFNYVKVKGTGDLIKIIKAGTLPNICILSHPERWRKDLASYSYRYLLDLVFSWGKVVIYIFRKK